MRLKIASRPNQSRNDYVKKKGAISWRHKAKVGSGNFGLGKRNGASRHFWYLFAKIVSNDYRVPESQSRIGIVKLN